MSPVARFGGAPIHLVQADGLQNRWHGQDSKRVSGRTKTERLHWAVAERRARPDGFVKQVPGEEPDYGMGGMVW